MTCRGKAVIGLVAAVLLLAGSIGWSATIVKDGDPNTIGAALAQQDGSTVTLTCEQVMWCGKSGKSFAIREWSEASPQRPRLMIVSSSELLVSAYWSVDIKGTIQSFTATLPTGATYRQRVVVVSPENVRVYCDQKGRICDLPLPAGMLSSCFTTRPLVISFSDVAVVAGQLPALPDTPDAPLPVAGSSDTIKSLPNGAVVSINGAVVSGSFNGRFCIERSDRSFAMWVFYPGTIAKGNLVDITGHLTTEGTSKVLIADSVTTLDTDFPEMDIVGMNNRDTNYGLDTTGLFVRLWGKVTWVGSDPNNRVFYINDGSNLVSDLVDVLGVKVYDTTTDTLPSVDDYVAVNGYSGSESPGIRTLWKYVSGTSYYSLMSLAPITEGTGIVSGTITATGADGKTARVYCGNASTKVVFSGDTATYSLAVPYGRRVVTVALPGYKTTTKLVRVDGSASDPTYNVTLPALSMKIDFITVASGSLADGTQEVTITAILRDEEGRRIGNASITWNAGNSAVYRADSATDVIGEAKAVIRYAPGTAPAIEACAGAVTERCHVAQ
ncbi:MAG: Ig-like domain-containing protein [Armatimonadota bacterium]